MITREEERMDRVEQIRTSPEPHDDTGWCNGVIEVPLRLHFASDTVENAPSADSMARRSSWWIQKICTRDPRHIQDQSKHISLRFERDRGQNARDRTQIIHFRVV